MQDGQAGLGHPLWRGGGWWGVATVEGGLEGRVERVFKGTYITYSPIPGKPPVCFGLCISLPKTLTPKL